jgi:hypothetical protein
LELLKIGEGDQQLVVDAVKHRDIGETYEATSQAAMPVEDR